MNERETIIGIPGPWKDRKDFLLRIVTTTGGEFMWAGLILMNSKEKDHVKAELYEADPHMRTAFEYAGHGKLPAQTLDEVERHLTTIYLHFPLAVSGQQQRLKRFTGVVKEVGGIAVKIETCGVAHTWETWEEILDSENPFDLYRGFVTLTGDEDCYYSCGMHHFSLPEVQVPRALEIPEAAELMNQFNYYQIVEQPELSSGHTFSLTPDSPRYRLNLVEDTRHEPDDLFHNPHGVWDCR
jgi:hypothetical protein